MRADMQNRRPILVLIIVIPAVLLLILLAGPWKLLERDSTHIALRNMEEVDRIVLVGSYSTTELSKSDSTWYLFTSEAVSPVAVENLLFTASRLEAASIVGLEVFEETTDKHGDVREITFFRGDKVLLACRLKMVSGQYLLHPKDSQKAYYVSLPGYPGLEIDRIFSATPDHYREHLLIDLPPSDISSIEFDLASGEAFRFTQDLEGQITCYPDNDYTILPDGIPNELAMKLLFSYFTSIRFEQRAGIPADSLLGAEAIERKLASVRVTSFSGEQHFMQVFSYHETPGSKPHLFRALVLYNDEQDALFVNYIYLDVLMRGLSHYFGEK